MRARLCRFLSRPCHHTGNDEARRLRRHVSRDVCGARLRAPAHHWRRDLPHGLCRPCRGCWRGLPTSTVARPRARRVPAVTNRTARAAQQPRGHQVRPDYLPPQIAAQQPKPQAPATYSRRRFGDPYPQSVMVRWRCRHVPYAAARRHSLRARSRLQLVALRTCHKRNSCDFVAVYFSARRSARRRKSRQPAREYAAGLSRLPLIAGPRLRPPCPPSLLRRRSCPPPVLSPCAQFLARATAKGRGAGTNASGFTEKGRQSHEKHILTQSHREGSDSGQSAICRHNAPQQAAAAHTHRA